MVFYLCGVKALAAPQILLKLPCNGGALTSASQPHAAALTLTFSTKHLSIIMSQVSMTSPKANELWGCKSKTLFPLRFMWLSIFYMPCSTVAEHGKWFSTLQMKNSGTSDQQLGLLAKMSGQLGVFSDCGRFIKYWPSWIFKRNGCLKMKYSMKGALIKK